MLFGCLGFLGFGICYLCLGCLGALRVLSIAFREASMQSRGFGGPRSRGLGVWDIGRLTAL